VVAARLVHVAVAAVQWLAGVRARLVGGVQREAVQGIADDRRVAVGSGARGERHALAEHADRVGVVVWYWHIGLAWPSQSSSVSASTTGASSPFAFCGPKKGTPFTMKPIGPRESTTLVVVAAHAGWSGKVTTQACATTWLGVDWFDV
jgi:hypothetical protein